MADVPALYRRAAERFGEHVAAVRDDQWGGGTPCTEWDVRALVAHLTDEQLWVPPLMAGRTIAEAQPSIPADPLGDDPKSAWSAANAEAVAAMATPGAMTRTVHLSFGDFPGEEYCFQVGSDLLIHGWDLARAIGADDRLDPDLADLAYQRWLPREGELRGSSMFGPEVKIPGAAPTQTKLLALFGRAA